MGDEIMAKENVVRFLVLTQENGEIKKSLKAFQRSMKRKS